MLLVRLVQRLRILRARRAPTYHHVTNAIAGKALQTLRIALRLLRQKFFHPLYDLRRLRYQIFCHGLKLLAAGGVDPQTPFFGLG